MEAKGKRLQKYSGITLGAVLIMAFVLVQPALNQAYAVGVEGLPGYDSCDLPENPPGDLISMNTVKSKNIVKTIHAEKETYFCHLDQGELPVVVDVTTYLEIYEDVDDRKVIETNAVATTCLKHEFTAVVIDCESYNIPSTPVPVGSDCEEPDRSVFTHPQEMNTVTKGKIAKTIEAQKEVFLCSLIQSKPDVSKKVDIVIFTDIYEDLSTQTVLEVQFHVFRCVALNFDDVSVSDGGRRDATVETCQFSSIEN